MLRRNATVALLFVFLVSPSAAFAQQPSPSPTPVPQTTAPAQAATTPAKDPNDPIERIKDEGMNRSQVMKTLSYLSDVIGPRLTASPGMKRSNEWTRDQLTEVGTSECASRSVGTFRSRLDTQAILGAGLGAAKHSAHRLSESLVAGHGWTADRRGGLR